MTIEFPFGMGQAVRVKGENVGEVCGLWINSDGMKQVRLRWKKDTGAWREGWHRCDNCEAADFLEEGVSP